MFDVKNTLIPYANCDGPAQPGHARGLIRTFAVRRSLLQHSGSLFAENEGSDQTATAQANLGLRCSHMWYRPLIS